MIDERKIEIICKPQGSTINMVEFTELFLKGKGYISKAYANMCMTKDITLLHYVIDVDNNETEIIMPEPGDTKEEVAIVILEVIQELLGEPVGRSLELVNCLSRQIVGNVGSDGYIISFRPL